MANKVMLSGMVMDQPIFSHKDAEKMLYKTRIAYTRRNGKKQDIVPVVLDEKDIERLEIKAGEYVQVIGKYCSNIYETKNKTKRRKNYILANKVEPWSSDMNEIVVDGFVEKAPVLRQLPNETTACEIVLFNKTSFSGYYLPVVFWGHNAQKAMKLQIGDKISIKGMVQSRRVRKESKSGKIVYSASDISVVHFEKIVGDAND